jgi:hypothetical protein
MRFAALALVAALLVSCVGTTGGEVIDFNAFASGPPGAKAGMQFTTGLGWRVRLDKAVLHVGAVYLNEAVPVSGSQPTQCILPGTYVAEVTHGLDVNLLSSKPQPFPRRGVGTTIPARAGEVWLTSGDVNQLQDVSPVLVIAGTAVKGDRTIPFSGKVTIGSNRQPGTSSPICKQRVVSPLPVHLTLTKGGSLRLIIDPRLLFVNVDFGQLAKFSSGYAFQDNSDDQPSRNLYQNLRSAGALYRFEWEAR